MANDEELDLLPWEHQPSEPPRAYKVFELYCLMAEERSIRAAAVKYYEQSGQAVPPNPASAFLTAARRWRWQERADCYWRMERRRAERLMQARRDAIYKRYAIVAEQALEKLIERGIERAKAEPWGKPFVESMAKLLEVHRFVLGDTPEERAAHDGRQQDRIGDLPEIESRLRPPEK